MPVHSSHGNGRFEQALIAVLVTALCVTALAFVALPRNGNPVALVPLNAEAARRLPQLIKAPETLLLARGTLEGSLIVQGGTPGFLEVLRSHGVLAINATAPGCGPAKAGVTP